MARASASNEGPIMYANNALREGHVHRPEANRCADRGLEASSEALASIMRRGPEYGYLATTLLNASRSSGLGPFSNQVCSCFGVMVTSFRGWR